MRSARTSPPSRLQENLIRPSHFDRNKGGAIMSNKTRRPAPRRGGQARPLLTCEENRCDMRRMLQLRCPHDARGLFFQGFPVPKCAPRRLHTYIRATHTHTGMNAGIVPCHLTTKAAAASAQLGLLLYIGSKLWCR